MNESLYYEKISEHRDSYYVEYQPPVASNPFATLNLIFLGQPELAAVADCMRVELEHWLRRFPVPLMIWGWDAKEDMLRPGLNGANCLVGWLSPGTSEIVSSWNIDDLSAFIKSSPSPPDWRTIYRDVAFKTDERVKQEADREVRKIRLRNRYLKSLLFVWLAAIPAGWAVFQYFGPEWLGLVLLIYALAQAGRAGYRIWYNREPSAREKEKAERQRKMSHYYLHCERNPSAFARLMAENYEKDAAERIAKESAAISGHDSR